MKTRVINNLILTQVSENRKTSHLYSNCTLEIRKPTLEECNFTKTIVYQANGYDENHIKMATIHYEDGSTFGEVLVGFTIIKGGKYMLKHISPIGDHNWTMVLTERTTFASFVINERKTNGKLYTSAVNGSLKFVFKECVYDGDVEYDAPAEYGGDYTAKCKACGSIFQTNFIKIYTCPICGYSKSFNINK